MRKRRVSGKDVVKTLTRKFGFDFVKQRGSHIKLRRYDSRLDKIITTVVPDHKELDYGTLRGVLRLARIEEKDFWDKLK